MIRKATIGAAVPAPKAPGGVGGADRGAARSAIGVHFETARVAAGNVAPSPMPSTRRTPNSEASPVTAPVAMVVSDHDQAADRQRAPRAKAVGKTSPRLAETGHRRN